MGPLVRNSQNGEMMLDQLDVAARETADRNPPSFEEDIALDDNGLTVLRKRYLLRGPNGEPAETPAEMFWRVASTVAQPDSEYGDDAWSTAKAFTAC